MLERSLEKIDGDIKKDTYYETQKYIEHKNDLCSGVKKDCLRVTHYTKFGCQSKIALGKNRIKMFESREKSKRVPAYVSKLSNHHILYAKTIISCFLLTLYQKTFKMVLAKKYSPQKTAAPTDHAHN